MEMEVRISTTEMETQPKTGDSIEGFDKVKLKELIAEGKLDFDEWTSLILEVESLCADELEKICLVYDSFLSEFPLCYGYWRKYAEHMVRLCTVDKAVEVLERAVQAATYSVGLWVDYCGFAISVFQDANDIRRLFKRALSFVGKDYLCHTLWDKYVEFEFTQQQWSSLANVYIQTLRFPSKKLHRYYESFQKLAATWKEDMQCLNDLDLQSDCRVENEASACYTEDEISRVIKDLLDPTCVDFTKVLEKYLSIGKQLYREASLLDKKIHRFESGIRRPYFHIKSLEISQLENWHEYLNFVEMYGDFDWAVKLYERCLIPCANYPEFWMRYVDYVESKGGREIANFALDRATQVFLKRMPVMHRFNARFKEKIRDVSGAHAALLEHETESDLSFVETVSIKANMEKRLGNFEAALNTYKEAVEIAVTKEKFDILPMLYIHFSRLQYMITNNSNAARDILVEGINRVPHCKLLLEELIKFGMMHGGPGDIHALDTIINDLINLWLPQGMSAKEAEEISSLYLQFVDLCGTIDDIRKAWKRHINSFPSSARMSSYVFSVKGMKPIPTKMTASGRQENLSALPSHPSGDGSFGIPTRSPSVEKSVKHSDNDDTQPNHAASDLVLEKKSPVQDIHEIPSDQAIINRHQSGEIDMSLQEGKMQHRSDDVSKHLTEDIKANSKFSSPDSVHEVTNEVEVLQTSEGNIKENDSQQEHDHKSEQDLNHLSLERLSLDHKSLDSNRFTNQEGESVLQTSLSNGSLVKKEHPQEISMFDGSAPEGVQSNDGDDLVSSPRSARASDSAGIQTEMASPSSSASQPNIKKTEPLSKRSPPYGGRSWHQSSDADRGYRENKFGFRRHSHRRLHQRRQVSPQGQYPRGETSTQMPMGQGHSIQAMSSQSPQVQQGGQVPNQYSTFAAQPNAAPANACFMQNMQQQHFVPSHSQLLPAYPQPQISQHPMQSNEQLGEMQNSQAYNQMWQYYYYQQQQQHQFLLQQQQQQPQNQHHPQQQLLQQHYHQHQQMLQVQQQYLQQQQLPYQHPQLLQLQQQQQFVQHQQQQHQLIQQEGSHPQQLPPQNRLTLQHHQEEQLTTSQAME